MKVFKFGGASIKDAAAIKNVAEIIQAYNGEKLLVVISALGKTTNALEEVVAHFHKGNEKALEEIDALEGEHQEIAHTLFPDADHPVFKDLNTLFADLRNIPKQYNIDDYNFLYDQVVSFGELFSTKIVAHYLVTLRVNTEWLDVRTILKTDNAYREAKVNWEVTKQQIQDTVQPILEDKIIVTQGFIGSTSSNHSTTLGREGSDFTASIFSYFLEPEELAIWKDVPGVLNANPTLFKDVSKIDFIPYEEAIEMTYYGAQVIHPKTIKPLQNKRIPLHVRSFIDKDLPGTIIHDKPLPADTPPIIVYKQNQVLLVLTTKDFSFMAEGNLGEVYDIFSKIRIKANLMQNAAISLSVCIDFNEDKLSELLGALKPHFNVTADDEVKLLTIRHYNNDIVADLTVNKEIVITQRTKDTVQFVLKE